MKLIIAGSRGFNDYRFARECFIGFIEKHGVPETIVSGGARGADRIGEVLAKDFGISLRKMNAEWKIYGPRAGYLRNVEMAKNADALLAFWDGHSRGTNHMISAAVGRNLLTEIIMYND